MVHLSAIDQCHVVSGDGNTIINSEGEPIQCQQLEGLRHQITYNQLTKYVANLKESEKNPGGIIFTDEGKKILENLQSSEQGLAYMQANAPLFADCLNELGIQATSLQPKALSEAIIEKNPDIALTLIQYGGYSDEEIQLLQKPTATLSAHEKTHRQELWKRFTGETGRDGTGYKILQELQNQRGGNPDELSRISAAIPLLLAEQGKLNESVLFQSQYQQDSKNSVFWNHQAEISVQHVTKMSENYSMKEIKDDEIRTIINRTKEQILAKGKGGQLEDEKLLALASIINKNGRAENPTQRALGIQTILDLTAEGKNLNYGRTQLSEKINEWNQKYGKLLEGKKPDFYEKTIKGKEKQEQFIRQIAAYELAQTASKLMVAQEHGSEAAQTANLIDKYFGTQIGKRIGTEKIKEGMGHKVLGVDLHFSEAQIKKAGDIAKNIMTPSGIATFYLLKYGGVLMTIFNLIAFVQHRNPQALAYAGIGAGMTYSGVRSVRGNLVDTMFHPERKNFNMLGEINNSNPEILEELRVNGKFYEQIDLNNPQSEQIFKRKMNSIEDKEERKEEKERRKAKEKGESRRKQRYTPLLSKNEFLTVKTYDEEEKEKVTHGSLQRLLLKGADTEYIASLDDEEINQRNRYKTLEWLFRKNVKNGDLHEMEMLSDLIRKTKGGKINETKKIQTPLDRLLNREPQQ